jgi:uncharacterized membrane protein YciS (DUF1049 family)
MPDYKRMHPSTTVKSPLHSAGRARQNGATIVIVLVLLIGLTVITLGSTVDTEFQFKTVRNDQFYTSAYLSAYSEINAQLGSINNNEEADSDELILDLLTYTVGESNPVLQEDLVGPHKGVGAFIQDVSYTLSCNPSYCPSPPGYTASEITKVLRATIDSQADMVASGASSSQQQSFWYLLPQTDLVTFD